MAKLVSIWGALPHDSRRATVSVVIPALNEARNLPYVAARMPGDIDEIIVVDGHSVDDTAAVARELWPQALLVTQTRTGKGNALACGFAVASGDIIVMMDADGSTCPTEIPQYIGALISGADFAKGSRFIQGGGSADITRFRRFGNWGLVGIVNALFSTKYTDLCYGFNAFWRHCLEPMCLPDIHAQASQWGDGFEIEALINVRLAASGLQIAEVCSYENARMYGLSNLHAISDGMRVLRTIQTEFVQLKNTCKRSKLTGGVVETLADDQPAITQPVRNGASEVGEGLRSVPRLRTRAHLEALVDEPVDDRGA